MHLHKKNFEETGKNSLVPGPVEAQSADWCVGLPWERPAQHQQTESPGGLGSTGRLYSQDEYQWSSAGYATEISALPELCFSYWKILRSEFNISGWMPMPISTEPSPISCYFDLVPKKLSFLLTKP